MFLKKRFIALFLAVFLIVSSVTGGYKEAYALPVAIPLVVVLMLLVGSVAVGAGVDIQVNDWTGLTKDLSKSLYEGDTQVSNWMAEIFSWALDGQGNTMLSALTAGTAITAINLWDYSIPIGAATIATTVIIKNAVIDFLCDKLGIEELKPQGDIPLTAEDARNVQDAVNRYEQYKSSYPYMVIIRDNGTSQPYFYTMYFSAYPFYIYYNSPDNNIYLRGSSPGTTYYQTMAVSNVDFLHSTIYTRTVQASWDFQASSANHKIVYANKPVYNMSMDSNGRFTNLTSIYYQSAISVPATAIDLNDDDLDVIPITSGLATKVADINIDNVGDIKSTDQLVSISADAIIDTKPRTITDVWNRVKALPAEIGVAVNGVLEKAFVPSQTAVGNFVSTAQEKVESGTSIFTYPFEVVVAFTGGFNDLGVQDCILVIPKIEFKDYTLYPGYSFNFTQYVAQSHFATIYMYYLYFVNFVLSISVLNLALRKWDEFMTGGMS